MPKYCSTPSTLLEISLGFYSPHLWQFTLQWLEIRATVMSNFMTVHEVTFYSLTRWVLCFACCPSPYAARARSGICLWVRSTVPAAGGQMCTWYPLYTGRLTKRRPGGVQLINNCTRLSLRWIITDTLWGYVSIPPPRTVLLPERSVPLPPSAVGRCWYGNIYGRCRG